MHPLYLVAMTTTTNDTNWMARQPWAIPVLLGLAALTIGFDLYSGDAWSASRSVCFYGALFCYLMYQRTGRQPYRWAAFAGFALVVAVMVVGIGLKKGWW